MGASLLHVTAGISRTQGHRMTSLNNHYRVTARLMWSGLVTIENVYDLKVAVAGTDDDDDVLAAAADWLDAAYQYINIHVHNTVAYLDVKGFNVSADHPIAAAAWPSLTTGASTADPIATGVSALVLFYTAKSRVLGRKFIGGLTENEWSGALMVAGFLTDLINYAITIMGGPATLTGGTVLDYGIYSKSGIFYKPPRFVVSAIPAYQRRRRQGVGI